MELRPGRLLSILLRALMLFTTGKWCDKVLCGQLTEDRGIQEKQWKAEGSQTREAALRKKKLGSRAWEEGARVRVGGWEVRWGGRRWAAGQGSQGLWPRWFLKMSLPAPISF